LKTTFLEFEQPIAELETRIEELRFVQDDSAVDISEEIQRLTKRSQSLTKDIYGKLTPWQVAQVARHPQRPFTLDYVQALFTSFEELHGDRTFADDTSIVGGLARFNGAACMVIGHQKGRDTKEKIARNFGMPKPEGYRKALRLMKLAEKFGLPVFTFVDTPGAYPGIDAEERGQSEAIGRNLFEMARLKVPVIVTIIGEGGSGGALAIAVGDVIQMMQYAIYSVISPEGCASILWRSAEMAPDAAEALGHNGLAFVLEEDRSAVNAAFLRLLARPGASEVLRVRFRHKDGGQRLLESTLVNRLGDPEVAAFTCSFRDLTREEEQRARFEATFEHAPVGLAHVDLEGRILIANRRLCAMLGYARDELLGRTMRELSHPEDVGATAAHIAQLRAGAIPQFAARKRYLRKDGSVVWAQLTVTLERDAQGAALYDIAAFEDVSEMVRAEEQLRASAGG